MSEMIPFRYAGFWDVPRYLLLKYRGTSLYLFSEFDEAPDEYSESYWVYHVPAFLEPRLHEKDWGGICNMKLECLGTIKVQDVHFDESKRKMLDSECFDRIERMPTST